MTTETDSSERAKPDVLKVLSMADDYAGGHLNTENYRQGIRADLEQAAIAACEAWAAQVVEQRMADEMHDYQMVLRHCLHIYDIASRGRISKPNTLPEEVERVMYDCEREEQDEAVKEATEEIAAERDAAKADAAILRGLLVRFRSLEGSNNRGAMKAWLSDIDTYLGVKQV